MHRASPPDGPSNECKRRSSPRGKPNWPSKMASIVILTSIDLRTKGMMVLPIRAFTVDGYVRCVGFGHVNVSSCAMFRNSTLSRVPFASVWIVPFALYLVRSDELPAGGRSGGKQESYPNESPLSPCS